MSDRKRLIFFASADPRTEPGPSWSAYHFAKIAADAGLDAEVRLAGDAVRLAQPGGVEESDTGRQLLEKSRAGRGEPFLVSL
jgi:hypothetical protein